MSKIEKRLAEMGLRLPETPKANGLYEVFHVEGNVLFTSGQLSRGEHGVIGGCLAKDEPLDLAQEAARICVLRCLAVVKAAAGSLDLVEQCIKVNGFVAAHPDFTMHSKVLDAASELLLEIFGDRGRHVRTAVGVPSLPGGGLVELEMSVRLSEAT
ncbi:RidA family protein [Roseibium marinum]|uniref:Enamine deaminase RidA (YjgF/YER057c/UK114 family) n=1 Tax=Roseibium marinum TaxID=281252 RepID=A0A2S3UN43_9HYPH|nr:RidA family protein [Roseibium marinum]POF29132.1 enamine deaminase RidA (YjgF/YER057c/UK114 family) [Roseibium marinum]